MARDDWYRAERWDEQHREVFEAKLARARPENRPQYLRIQGVCLAGSDRVADRAVARELLERVLAMDDDYEAAVAHADLARLLVEDDELRRAAEHYRACLAGERRFGVTSATGSELELAELIVRAEWPEDYAEARELLEVAAEQGLLFRSQRWRWYVTVARIAARTGEPAAAAELAAEALALLGEHEPDVPRHPQLGHIETDDETVEEVRGLAAARS